MNIQKMTQFISFKKAFFIALLIFSFSIIFVDSAKAADWKKTPAQCPSVYEGYGQTGGPGEGMCGVLGNTALWFSTSSLVLLVPTSSTSTNNTPGQSLGGYVVDCHAYDASPLPDGPFCDNNTNFWCSPDPSCNSLYVKTTCNASKWAIDSGAFTCVTPGAAPSTTGCISGYANCNIGTSDPNNCEVRIGVTTCTGAGGLQGTFNASCDCIVPASNFRTGIQAEFLTSSPLLWGKQYGDGDLIRFTNNAVATSSFVVFNSGQVAVGHNINISTTSVAFEVSSTERGILIPRLGGNPVGSVEGELYYNSVTHKFVYNNGTSWGNLSGLPSGTIGQILVNNGGENWVTSSVILVNTTTGRVGIRIGSNNPIAALEIGSGGSASMSFGNADNSIIIQGDGGSNFFESYNTDGASGLILRNTMYSATGDIAGIINEEDAFSGWDSGLHILSQSGDPLIFKTGSTTERMRITSNGNVGIGTTSPVFKLSLGDDGGIYSASPNYIPGGLYGGEPLSGTVLPNSSGTLMFWYPRKAAFRAGVIAPTMFNGDAWNDESIGISSAVFGINNMASGTASFVGGGVFNTAQGASSFIGGGRYNTTTDNGYYSFIGNGRYNEISGSDSFIGGGYLNKVIGNYSIAFGYGMTVSGTNSFGINVSTTPAVLGQNNTIALMGGNVGIGTTSPNALLDISSNNPVLRISDHRSSAAASTSLMFIRGTSTVFGGDNYSDWEIKNSNGNLSFTAGRDGYNTTSLFLHNNGNVGINNINPLAKLHVADDGSILAEGTYGSGWDGNGVFSGSKMMWIPKKAAFRAGYTNTTYWIPDNVGLYSVAFGNYNQAFGVFSVVAGGSSNFAIGDGSAVVGGSGNRANYDYSSVGGGGSNIVSNTYSNIGGGRSNISYGQYSFIGGGYFNTVSGTYSAITGGYDNDVNSSSAFIGGGYQNRAWGQYSSVVGGYRNYATGSYSFIGGGNQNTAEGQYSAVLGGTSNSANAYGSAIIGNNTTINGAWSVGINISSGSNLTIEDSGRFIVWGGRSAIGTTTADLLNGLVIGGALRVAGTTAGTPYFYACISDTTGRIYKSSSACSGSDERLKNNIISISSERDVLGDLNKLRGVYYYWNTSTYSGNGDKRQIGLIAQEVEEVLPELIGEGIEGYKTFDYPRLTAFLVEVAKAQQAEIEALREAVSTTLSVQQSGGQLVYENGDLDLQNYALLNVKYISGANNKWAIDENGQFITRIQTSGGNTKEMFAMQSPYSEFVFSSSSELINGEAIINFDPDTCELIDENQPLKVNITLTGECGGIFVKEKSATGFVVKELNGGTSTSTFDWMVIAKRKFATTSPQSSPSQGEEGVPSPLEGEGDDEVEIPSTLEGEGEAEPLTETGDGGEVVTTTPEIPPEPPIEESTTTPEVLPEPPIEEPPAEAEPLTEQSSGDGEPTP